MSPDTLYPVLIACGVCAVFAWLGAYQAWRSVRKAEALDRVNRHTITEMKKLCTLGNSIRDDHVAKIYAHVRIVKAVAEQTGNAALAQQAEELLAQEKAKGAEAA